MRIHRWNWVLNSSHHGARVYLKEFGSLVQSPLSGTYTGHLWTSSGTLLSTAVFTNVSANGWQEVLFSAPIPIKADTIYVASYHTKTGITRLQPADWQVL